LSGETGEGTTTGPRTIDHGPVRFEIGHVLFIDIVGYSKLLITEQTEEIQTLKKIVRGTEEFQSANAESKLIGLPTGDGGALVFRTSLEAPLRCAIEISHRLKEHPELQVRMGIHSGPVNEVADLNEQMNAAGAGINMAQRVMDCGDAGHILLSQRAADDLEQYPRWRPSMHSLGECRVKHGVRLGVVNFYDTTIGNPTAPKKFQALKMRRARVRWAAVTAAVMVVAATIASFLVVSERAMNWALTVPAKSIAVLPFTNMSEDKSNSYFADGVQDEILEDLAKIADLKVISRTSVTGYKSGATRNLREIARELGVSHVVEGSVQRVANRIRVTAQLIDARNDSHVWAEHYDRALDDVFAIQTEIATRIAEQLNAKLSADEQKVVASRPTKSIEAYDAYLRGRSLQVTTGGEEAWPQIEAAYAGAVRLDPDFAVAWARLAIARGKLSGSSEKYTAAMFREAADRALILQPELGEAWLAQGLYRNIMLNDYPGAMQAYEEAHKRLPNDPTVLMQMAYLERRFDHWDSALAHLQQAVSLDPRNLETIFGLQAVLKEMRRFTEAHAVVDQALQWNPDNEKLQGCKRGFYLLEGRLDELARAFARLPPGHYLGRARLFAYQRRFDDAVAQIQAYLDDVAKEGDADDQREAKGYLVWLGFYQEWAGHKNEAAVTFTRAVEANTSGVAMDLNHGWAVRGLALAYAGLRRKAEAIDIAQRAIAAFSFDYKPENEMTLAMIQARFGEADNAIPILEYLLQTPNDELLTPGTLRFDPIWDPIRQDPRFQKLCEEKPK
jgi:TolB-like protein